MGDDATRMEPPKLIVIGGPNGAGKSTAARWLLPEGMAFVNADEVAKGLPNYPSRAADLEAGRLVLDRMDELARQRIDFAVETTLAGRSLARRIVRLRDEGYRVWLVMAWAPSAEFCIERVRARVEAGGHNIPEETIRRRYAAGLRNFFELYRPVADRWEVFASSGKIPESIASGRMGGEVQVQNPTLWGRMQEEAGHA